MTTLAIIYLIVYFVAWVAIFILASERYEHFRGRQLTWMELIILTFSMPYGGLVLLLLLDKNEEK